MSDKRNCDTINKWKTSNTKKTERWCNGDPPTYKHVGFLAMIIMSSIDEMKQFCEKYHITMIDRPLEEIDIDDTVLDFFKPTEAIAYKILPWRIDTVGASSSLRLFTCNTKIFMLEQEILAKTKGAANKIEITFLPENHLTDAIIKYYRMEENVVKNAVDISLVEDEPDDTIDLLEESLEDANSPTVQLVNNIIISAIQKHASDIHFEPERAGMIIKFRVDGTLIVQDKFRIPEKSKGTVIARLKIMANLDVSKKRDTQDGQITLKYNNNNIDFRVSIVPVINGEKCVLRILDKANSLLSLDFMGFLPNDIILFNKIINKPTGVILLTGPTGSGKSTTLYALLSRIDAVSRNITTIENPVEYQIDHINQIQVDEKHVSFATALRAILRQDPNVIMLGEVRDADTAENMVQSSQTGHLVLSTVHTNDSVSAIGRLKRLGIQEDSIAQTLSLVIAQRLVKKICPNCKEEYIPDFEAFGVSEANIRYLKKGNHTFIHGRGCEECDYTGYKGRTVAYEFFEMNDDIREMVENGKNAYEIRRALFAKGMISMWHFALDLVRKDITTIEEVCKEVLESREKFE